VAKPSSPTAPQTEIGYQLAPNHYWWLYDNETTPELQWPQSVYVYDQMRRTDSQCMSVLRAVTLPVRRTPWRIDPNGAREEVVRLVADDLGLPIVGRQDVVAPPRQKDRFSWPEHLRLALLMLPFGHAYFEQVYRVEDDGSAAHLRKLAYRPPTTIERIDVAADGGLVSIRQHWTAMDSKPQPIPVDRLVAYINEREGGNWLGMSLLRPAYKNWLLKDRLLRVQAQTVERNGMGVPVYEGQEGASGDDLAAGKAMASAYRSGEAAGAATPFGAKLRLLGVEGTLPDADKPIRYHDEQIARAVLAHFLNLGTETGSWALGSTFADFFTLSLQTLAQQIADTATQHVVEDLVDVNFGPSEPAPRLVFDEIGSRQPATAEAMKTLVDAGILHPDEVLEGAARQYYGLPPADPATSFATEDANAAVDTATPPTDQAFGAESVAASAEPDFDDEASWVAAAAGIDTHPGGEQLKHYWVFGKGAALWATWYELRDHLRKYIKGERLLKATVSAWYKLRYGHMPPHHGVHASADVGEDFYDEADEWELAIDALCAALDELSGAVAAAFNPDLHPRNPKGAAGGGRFRSTVDRLKDALTEHKKSGGKGDPFEGFDREQLRRAAVKQGIKLGRGESRDSIAKKLTGHIGAPAERHPHPSPEASPDKPNARSRRSSSKPASAPSADSKQKVPIGDILAAGENPRGTLSARRKAHEKAVRGSVEGTFGGLKVELTHMSGPDAGYISLEGQMLDGQGQKVGHFRRVIRRGEDGKLAAEHDILVLEPHVQGSGFAREFNGNLFDWYRQSGVDRVETHADIDVGGYTWATQGFDFRDDAAAREWLDGAQERLHGAMAARADARERILARFPGMTPAQFDAELRKMEGMLTRMERGEQVSAYELSQFGRKPGQGRNDMWIGKYMTLGSEWDAVLRL
jgi:hypothetical protein